MLGRGNTNDLIQTTVKRLGEGRALWQEKNADTAVWIVTVGADGQEGVDRASMDLDEADRAELETAIQEAKDCGGKVVVILNSAGPVSLMPYLEDIDALLMTYFPGMRGGKALVDILFGDVNPSGKLPITYDRLFPCVFCLIERAAEQRLVFGVEAHIRAIPALLTGSGGDCKP